MLKKTYPGEGTAEWYEAVARSHLKCAEPNDRLRIPGASRQDHIAAAAVATAKAIALKSSLPKPSPQKPNQGT